MAKPFVLATLGYLVPTFLLGFTWHFWFFPGLYDGFGIYNRAEPVIPLGMLSMAIQALVMAYLYPFFRREGGSIGSGVVFGLLMGAFLFSVSTVANAAKIMVANVAAWFVVQAAFHVVQFVIAGALIGLAYRRPAAADAEQRPLPA
jgi:hypothetical protein